MKKIIKYSVAAVAVVATLLVSRTVRILFVMEKLSLS